MASSIFGARSRRSAVPSQTPTLADALRGGISEPVAESIQVYPSIPYDQYTLAQMNDALAFYEQDYFPGQRKSLSGIALRSMVLGIACGFFSFATIYVLSFTASPLWRIPMFLCLLALFHFLEFFLTARYNTEAAQVSSFLFSTNGSAYNIAHTGAVVECLLRTLIFQDHMFAGPLISRALLFLGLGLIVMGQAVRSLAMAKAGTNFSHLVRHAKKHSQELVTTGIYGVLRHPSYFGFFWWAVGTQLVLGNTVCLVGYVVVLWKFFSGRIRLEEDLMVTPRFFGEKYKEYRKTTIVGIPFIS